MRSAKVRARSRRAPHPVAGLLVSASFVGGMPSAAPALDLNITSNFAQHVSVRDNPGLSPVSAGTLVTSRTTFGSAILAQAPTFVIGTNLSMAYAAYAGSASGSRENRFQFSDLNFHAAKQMKTTSFTLTGSLSVDETATTQVDDTGIIDVSADQYTLNLNAGLSHNVNRNNTVSLNGRVTSVSFSEGADAFVPFTDINVSGAWKHLVNSRIQTGLTASIATFQRGMGSGLGGLGTSAGDSRTVVLRMSGNASVQLTKSISANGSLGTNVRWTEGTGAMAAGSDAMVGYSGSFSASYAGNRTGYSANVSHSLDPSAAGELRTRTRISISASHAIPINSRSSAAVAAGYSYRRSSSPTSGEITSQLFTLSPTYSVRLTPHWGANLGYTFTYRIREGEAARSNLVYLNITRSGTLLP